MLNVYLNRIVQVTGTLNLSRYIHYVQFTHAFHRNHVISPYCTLLNANLDNTPENIHNIDHQDIVKLTAHYTANRHARIHRLHKQASSYSSDGCPTDQKWWQCTAEIEYRSSLPFSETPPLCTSGVLVKKHICQVPIIVAREELEI